MTQIMEMKNVIERLNQFYDYKRFTNEEIGLMLGVSPKTVANNRSEKRGLKLVNLLGVLEQCKDLSAEWLLRGTGSMIKLGDGMNISVGVVNGNNNITASPNAIVSSEDSSYKRSTKPLIPIAVSKLTSLDIMNEYTNGNLCLPTTPAVDQFGDYTFGWVVPDNSMAPEYITGDRIAILLQDIKNVIDGNAYVLSTRKGMILRYVYDDGYAFVCKPVEGNRFTEMRVPKDSVYSILAVMGMLRTNC